MMRYEFSDDEWDSAVRDLTEVDRDVNADSHRAAQGITGEADDDRYGGQL
jgi:hypothetical protein